ncbi:MAG: hypothetical protein AAFZ92_04375 [Pseudomonadota bacterium]
MADPNSTLSTKAKPPTNALIDDHPVDTLSHIQSALTFIQEYAAKANEDVDITPYEIRVYSGLHALLKVINEAIDYEIGRLEQMDR